MSGRVYRIPFKALGLSTNAQDLWAVTTTSSMPCNIEEIRLDPCATSVAEFNVSLSLFTGSYSAGSGGSSATPQPTVHGDASAGTTCKLQNTTQTAVGSGTKTVLDAGSWNLVNGWAWQPLDPDHRICVPVSACFVASLDSTPASQTVSGCLILREMY
jgi:hypothetical protein